MTEQRIAARWCDSRSAWVGAAAWVWSLFALVVLDR